VTPSEGKIAVEGGSIWYEMAGNSAGTPLIFLHGGPGFPHYSFKCLELLRDERPVVFYDQLGCGKSDRPTDLGLWRVDRFVQELKSLVDSLDFEEFHLIGHSWGGGLAAQYALTYPKGIQKFILSSPLLSTHWWIEDANRLKKTLPGEVQVAITKNESNNTTDSEEYGHAIDEFYKRYWCRLDDLPPEVTQTQKEANRDIYKYMWGPSEFSCTGNLKEFDLTDELHTLVMPVLYTCGRFDEATPETILAFQKMTPHATLVVFEKSAHLAQLEEQSAFIATVRNFLK